ncbi:hypothetical protein M513_04168 [Trichuris suis]|uniref:Uncharacterized protein n=1 Tax=Trichuris suis TaxID=68888 RepID=A0A085MCP0_9BILA|nr:hypothetical protein M513_04168 [Trichuris suis]
MPDATTTIETVTVVRPLKVISLICEILALLTLLLSLSTCAWLKCEGYFKTGIFQECTYVYPRYHILPNGAPAPGQCHTSRIVEKGGRIHCMPLWAKVSSSHFHSHILRIHTLTLEQSSQRRDQMIHSAYFQITAALLILAAALILACICMTGAGLGTINYGQRYLYYRIAMYLSLIGLIAQQIAMVVFPLCFYFELEMWFGTTWELDWSVKAPLSCSFMIIVVGVLFVVRHRLGLVDLHILCLRPTNRRQGTRGSLLQGKDRLHQLANGRLTANLPKRFQFVYTLPGLLKLYPFLLSKLYRQKWRSIDKATTVVQ